MVGSTAYFSVDETVYYWGVLLVVVLGCTLVVVRAAQKVFAQVGLMDDLMEGLLVDMKDFEVVDWLVVA